MMRIALIAHDQMKSAMMEWARRHAGRLHGYRLYATGTTGRTILQALPDLDITLLKSGPLGGDQQVGALIATGDIDAVIFFIDPLTPLPHDVDVKALVRLSTLYNLPLACNEATADHIMTSPLFGP